MSGEDAEPRRHQVAELPPIEPEVHEYRLHRLSCPHYHTVTTAALPDGVPSTAFGARLHAALSVLTGDYRLSKRQVAQLCSDLLGLTISLGTIAKLERITAAVLEPPVVELAERVKTAEAAHIDETGWREGPPQGLALGRSDQGGRRLQDRPLPGLRSRPRPARR